MKIGIDIRVLGKKRTGDETYIKNLVKNLLSIDRENQYYFYTDIDDGKEVIEIKKIIDPNRQFKNYKIVSITPSHKLLWTFFALPKHIKKNPIDVLHVQYITPQSLPKKIKLITTIHDVSFNVFPQYINKLDLLFLKILIPLSLGKANKAIAVSSFTKKEIQRFYQPETKNKKTKAIYNGGADKRFKKMESLENSRVKEVRNKYNLPEKFILYIGSFQPRKNISLLLEAYRKLRRENRDNQEIKNIKLVLGGGREGNNYDQRIDEKLNEIKKNSENIHKDIILTGYIDDKDLPEIYKLADIFCFPSLYEGFGLPLIEAMTAGVPVLCSDSSCHKEIAAEGAEYFKGDNLDDFTKRMFDIIINEDKKKLLKDKGEKRARFFSWKKCAQQTLDTYQELVEKKK